MPFDTQISIYTFISQFSNNFHRKISENILHQVAFQHCCQFSGWRHWFYVFYSYGELDINYIVRAKLCSNKIWTIKGNPQDINNIQEIQIFNKYLTLLYFLKTSVIYIFWVNNFTLKLPIMSKNYTLTKYEQSTGCK